MTALRNGRRTTAAATCLAASAIVAAWAMADNTKPVGQRQESVEWWTWFQVYDAHLGPSNQVVADFNAKTGASFGDWDGEFKSRFGVLVRRPWRRGWTGRAFFAFTPLKGRLRGVQQVTGSFGPQTAGLDWDTRNYQAGLGVERAVPVRGNARFSVGLDMVVLKVKSSVSTSFQIPAANVTTTTHTDFKDVCVGYRVFAAAPVGSLSGHGLRVEFGYERLKPASLAVGTAVNPTGAPGNSTATPLSIPFRDDFSGLYLALATGL